jgi:Virulence protein
MASGEIILYTTEDGEANIRLHVNIVLERIRDIRALEKRFYQEIRDIYATSVDYNPKSEAAA